MIKKAVKQSAYTNRRPTLFFCPFGATTTGDARYLTECTVGGLWSSKFIDSH